MKYVNLGKLFFRVLFHMPYLSRVCKRRRNIMLVTENLAHIGPPSEYLIVAGGLTD